MRGNQCVPPDSSSFSPGLIHILSTVLVQPFAPPPDRLITSKDHASVQISIVDVDANGRALNTSTTFALCGQVRSQGEGDDSINRLATKAGRESFFCSLNDWAYIFGLAVLRNVWQYAK